MNLTNGKSKFFGIVAVVVLAVAAFAALRTYQAIGCSFKSYDLKRPTEFRILTGRCTTEGKDGKMIYVDQLRGVDGTL